jgi:hypothetical protein
VTRDDLWTLRPSGQVRSSSLPPHAQTRLEITLSSTVTASPIREITWTNPSVLGLAGPNDPVETIQKVARDTVLQAIDEGWSGPPFNPIQLADILKIRVQPNASVTDARTVAGPDGIKIEFNPLQARGRLRFSIAHEVAHTLFPDVGDSVRHRGGAVSGDDWQLEMLCNLAAAEFVMPVGSLSPMSTLPPIEKLMEERRRFDVSTEAYLLRATKVTAEPVLMFCASPIEREDKLLGYRIDYLVPSRSWSDARTIRPGPPRATVLGDCTGIGYTARAEEQWSELGAVSVECVGIPPYPGARLPRVAGLLRGGHSTHSQSAALNFVHGDIFEPRNDNPKIVCQLVNDVARRWGGGVAAQSARRFPDVQKAFSLWFSSLQGKDRLGKVFFGDTRSNFTLASMVAQRGLGPSDAPRIRYSALELCLQAVAHRALATHSSVHMPRIGTGEARGSWAVIESLVCDELVAPGVSTTVYDLPPTSSPDTNARFELIKR